MELLTEEQEEYLLWQAHQDRFMREEINKDVIQITDGRGEHVWNERREE